MVIHWCLYNEQNITYTLMDMNFIFSCSTRYLTRLLRSLVRYRVDHSKIKFISTHGYVISSMSVVGGRSKKHANTTFKATKHIERTFLISDYYLYNYKKLKIAASTIVSVKRVLLKKTLNSLSMKSMN